MLEYLAHYNIYLDFNTLKTLKEVNMLFYVMYFIKYFKIAVINLRK